MDIIGYALIVTVLVVAYNGKDWITAYWNNKAEANREIRLTAEAKLTLARISGTSPAIHP